MPLRVLLECIWSQQSAGNSLEQGHRLGTEEAVDDEGGSNVQNAARQAGPQHRKHSVWIFQGNLRPRIHKICPQAYTTDFTFPVIASRVQVKLDEILLNHSPVCRVGRRLFKDFKLWGCFSFLWLCLVGLSSFE